MTLFTRAAFLILISSSAAFAGSLTLKSSLLDGTSVKFLKFEGKGPFDSYLTMNLPFPPAAGLFKQVLVQEKTQLTNRGEAHITVITPVEFWNILKPQGVSMKEINKIAEDMKIQSSRFQPLCLGYGKATVDGNSERTFYIVVASDDLINIRREIQKLFISKGGSESAFVPTNYYPHVTIGFTKRDLHESDGVIKDAKSCVNDLQIVP